MNIKKVAEVTGVNAYTLRYYEKIGLIIHINKDQSRHRNYSAADVEWIGFLKRLKATGMSLADMKTFAILRTQGEASIGERKKLLEKHKQKVEAKLVELQSNLAKIKEKIAFYARGGVKT